MRCNHTSLQAASRVIGCFPSIAALTLLLVGLPAADATELGAGRPVVRPEAALIRMLTAPPSRWSISLAQVFVRTIPARIIEPLATQTAKTIPFFASQARVPKTGVPVDYFCWASVGNGGGYAAIIRRDNLQYLTVWDSLIPPTFIVPRIEFEDVDGDSTLEIICSGERLEGGGFEWTVLRWDGTEGRLLVPRLDLPSRSILYNRLIGRSLKIEDTPGDAAKTLILTLGEEPGSDPSVAADSAGQTRVFHYSKSADAFLPPP
jgi:hypothetical protein